MRARARSRAQGVALSLSHLVGITDGDVPPGLGHDILVNELSCVHRVVGRLLGPFTARPLARRYVASSGPISPFVAQEAVRGLLPRPTSRSP